MRARDVVAVLQSTLPQLTDRFTDDVEVESVARSGSEVTVVCSEAHSLEVGEAAVLTGAETPISIASFERTGAQAVITTATDHDLTDPVADEVRVEGAAEPEFNGAFPLLKVLTRTQLRVSVSDSGPTSATGSPVLLGGESFLRSYNRLFRVEAVPTPTSFVVLLDEALPDPRGDIVVRGRPRISRTITPERILESYTEQQERDHWAFVVLGDAFASKSREIQSDAQDGLQRGNFYRQQLVQPFSVFVCFPVHKTPGEEGRDEAEVLLRPLIRSLLLAKFDSGLAVGAQGPVQFVGHELYAYNTSVYVHAYNFQVVNDVTFLDTIGHDPDVALRCVDLTQTPDVPGGTEGSFLTASAIDLDETG